MHIYIYMHTHPRYKCIYLYVYTYIHTFTMYAHITHTRTHHTHPPARTISLCLYPSMCMYMYVYIDMYVCIYTYVHLPPPPPPFAHIVSKYSSRAPIASDTECVMPHAWMRQFTRMNAHTLILTYICGICGVWIPNTGNFMGVSSNLRYQLVNGWEARILPMIKVCSRMYESFYTYAGVVHIYHE